MPVELGKYNDYQDCWGASHNDAHLAYRSANEYILVELNSTSPPTVKQYSAYQVFQESSATLLATASGNNVYPPSTGITYYNAQAIFEDGGDRTFTWGAGDFPTPTTSLYYLECRSADDVSSTSRGLGSYGASTVVPTLNREKGGYYNTNGRVLASFSVNSTDIDSLHIYNVNFPREDGTVNQVLQTDGAGAISWAAFAPNVIYTVLTLSTSYVIDDSDNYEMFVCSPASDMSLTLPTASDNSGRPVNVKKTTATGKIIIYPEGAETLDGSTYTILYSQYDNATIVSDGSNWQVLKQKTSINTGWVNRSDWTNVHIGTPELTYDNISGTILDGEQVICTTTSSTATQATAIVMTSTGSTATVILREITSTGTTTLFPNNAVLEFVTSGVTADVNESGGSLKNLDDNYYHGLGKNLDCFGICLFFSTNASSVGMFNSGNGYDSGAGNKGHNLYQIDVNHAKIQTAAAGIVYWSDAGTAITIDTEDWWSNSLLEFTI